LRVSMCTSETADWLEAGEVRSVFCSTMFHFVVDTTLARLASWTVKHSFLSPTRTVGVAVKLVVPSASVRLK